MPSFEQQVDHLIEIALSEDVSRGDVTSDTLIPPRLRGDAVILVKARGILAGIEVAGRVFRKVDPSLKFEALIRDGSEVRNGDIAAHISGKVSSILKAERTALNFLCRLSGIASQTAQFVARTRGMAVEIRDTRKTTPGLRALQKYAVRMGGGVNHRLDLADGILIKDNHLVALRALGLSLKDIVAKAKKNAPPGVTVEVEVTTFQEAQDVVGVGADIIMLDNMSPDEMKRVINALPGGVKFEASGGVKLANVRAVAGSGVNIISVGALTHSSKALDMSLELQLETLKLV